ncbi:MAG: hypothetical protein ACI39N_07875 [Lachnospiraceae bacterium]
MGYVVSRIGIEGFITYFPRVFMDENLDSNFMSKLVHPIQKYIALGMMTIIPLIIVDKVNFISKLVSRLRLPIVTLLLCASYAIQTYIERYGITWHCINYPYTLTFFIISYIYIKNKTDSNRRVISIFGITTTGVILSMALASNQGNVTSMYGTIITSAALVLMLGKSEEWKNTEYIAKEKKAIICSLMLMGVFSYFVPVYEQESVELEPLEQRTIFTERVKVEYGPAKNLMLGVNTYEDYDALCSIVLNNVNEDDSLFIVGNYDNTSYGYLCTNAQYATYSPQGGWGLATSDRAMEYFEANPQKKPTVVIVDNNYIEQTMDDYLISTSIGNFLKDNYEIVIEENGYSVFR